jgi:hypothetical protein
MLVSFVINIELKEHDPCHMVDEAYLPHHSAGSPGPALIFPHLRESLHKNLMCRHSLPSPIPDIFESWKPGDKPAIDH